MYNDEAMLTTGEVAKRLGVCLSTVHTFMRRGYLTPDIESVDKKIVRRSFKQSTVDAFIQKYATGHYNGEPLFEVKDVALMLDVSPKSVNNYIISGTLLPDIIYPTTGKPGSRTTHGKRLFTKSTVAAFRASDKINWATL